MGEYIFTSDQLGALLRGVIELRDEYVNVHGKDPDTATWSAVLDTIDGLDAEKELLASGERFTPSQVLVSDDQLIPLRMMEGEWKVL